MNGTWARDGRMKGKIHKDAGELTDDKFTSLLSGAPGPKAKVSYSYSESLEYGSFKVGVSITVECDQNEKTINRAGEVAYMKARELVADGWSLLERDGKVASP